MSTSGSHPMTADRRVRNEKKATNRRIHWVGKYVCNCIEEPTGVVRPPHRHRSQDNNRRLAPSANECAAGQVSHWHRSPDNPPSDPSSPA